MLRAIAERAELTPTALSPEAAKHGCDLCRGQERRQAITRDLISEGQLCTARLRCTDCGADWLVSLFAKGARQELHVSFKPAQKRAAN